MFMRYLAYFSIIHHFTVVIVVFEEFHKHVSFRVRIYPVGTRIHEH